MAVSAVLNVDFNELQGDSLNAHATPFEDTDLISGRTVLYSSVTPVEDLEDVYVFNSFRP